MRSRLFLLCCYMTVILVAAARSAAGVEDEFVGVGIHLLVHTLMYSDGAWPTSTAFVGEPYEGVLTLQNNTKQVIGPRTRGREWRNGVTASIEHDASSPDEFSFDWVESPPAASTQIGPARSERAIFRIRYR